MKQIRRILKQMTPDKWIYLIAAIIVNFFFIVNISGNLSKLLKRYKWLFIIIGDVIALIILTNI